ncbi:MAG: T9SS type A sorting domain-containing protein [Bacteroidota bacterium]
MRVLFALLVLGLAMPAFAQPQLARITDAVAPLNAVTKPDQTLFLPFDGGAVFSGIGTDGDIALWRTDGTAGGTVKLTPPTGAGPANPGAPFAVFEGQVYFPGLDAQNTPRLWRMTPSGAPETVTNAEYRSGFTVVENTVYFTGCTDAEGCEPYASNGQSTDLLQDVNPGTFSSDPSGYAAWSGGVYFVANDGQTGREPWVTRGTDASTRQLADLYNGTQESRASGFSPTEALLYFVAEGKASGEDTQTGLWATDGTEVGTTLVAEAGLATYVVGHAGGELIVAARDDVAGQEPHQLTGSTLSLLADLSPGSIGSLGGSRPTVASFDGDLFFTAEGRVDASQVRQIWATDGTTLRQLEIPNAPRLTRYDRPIVAGGALYFTAALRETTSDAATVEVWRLLSADAAPERIGTLPADHAVNDWAPIGDRLLVSVRTDAFGTSSELWGIGYGTATATEASTDPQLELAVFPSPTQGRATVRYTLAAPSDVQLSVVDALGREVARLHSGRQIEGPHEVTWTPADPDPGLYVVRLRTSHASVTRQLVVVR